MASRLRVHTFSRRELLEPGAPARVASPEQPAPAPAFTAVPEFTFPMEEVPMPFTPEPLEYDPPHWSSRVLVGAPLRGASRHAPRKSHWFAKTLGVGILCALSTVGGAMLVPSGQPGEQDLFGMPSIRHYLPAAVAQRLPTQPRIGTAPPSPVASPPVTQAKAPALGIMVSPARANRGGAITVTGSGLNASQKFTVDLTQGGTNYQLQAATPVPANGIFSVSAIIPGKATPGAATIRACNVNPSGATGTCAQQQITVV